MPQKSILANFQEEITGQLTVGNCTVDFGSKPGTIVNVAKTEQRPLLRSLPSPVLIPEDTFEYLLGYQELLTQAISALEVRQSVEIYGTAGCGKTALLKWLMHIIQAMSVFPDGIINPSQPHPCVGDLLQSIWEAFYESNIPYKPTYHQIKEQIQDKQALIVLDDDELIQEELQELMNAALQCTFLITSSTKRIQKKGISICLSGLSTIDAISLIEQELRRSLTLEEIPAAKSLCTILNGQPLHLLLAVDNMLEEGRTLALVVSQLPSTEPGKYLIQQTMASLSQPQRTIVELLAIMGNVGLENRQVSQIAGISDTFSLLETLRRRHLIQLHNSRYKVSQTVLEVLPPEWKLTPIVENAIDYFTKWVEKYQKQPEYLSLEIDTIVQILEISVRNSHWQDVLRLVKAIERELALSKRWALWQQVLQRGLQASQAEQDKATEAWALHQLGTCALCLGESSTAKEYLTKAIQLREFLGESAGISVTRHNLNLLKNFSFLLSSSQQDLYKKNLNRQFSLTQLSLQDIITRMNIVSQRYSFKKPSDKNIFLLSLTGIVTIGILALGGLLAWFNLHRPTPRATTTTPSTTTEYTPNAIATPTPAVEPVPTVTVIVSPIPAHQPIVDPPLTPNFDLQQPTFIKPKKPQINTVPLKASPTVSATPEPTLTAEPTPQ